MVSTPGKTITIKGVGTFELLAIEMSNNAKVKVIYLNNGRPIFGAYPTLGVTIQ